MSSITTRAAKGSALTHAEVDANFTNLNSGKAEVSGQTFTGPVVVPAGTASAGGIQVGTNASLFSPGSGQVAISTNGTGRLFVDASGNVGINDATPNSYTNFTTLSLDGTTGSEIDLQSGGVVTGSLASSVSFCDLAANGGLRFFTAASSERMRISANGAVSIGTTGTSLGATDGVIVGALESSFTVSTAGQVPIRIYNKDTAGTRYCMEFRSASTAVGSITHNGTTTTYATTSDYRLKENVIPVPDGIARCKQLKPSRFNFKADPDHTVDGFIAHEAQAVVPECVTGEKGAVDDDGNPIYQGIDQSKLVPLLTAALQEAIAKIETLEARLTAAGIA